MLVMEIVNEIMSIITIVIMFLILRESLRNSRKIDRHVREILLLKAELEFMKRKALLKLMCLPLQTR